MLNLHPCGEHFQEYSYKNHVNINRAKDLNTLLTHETSCQDQHKGILSART